MGMTSDDAIYILENGLNVDGTWSNALNIAIDTMRKYQKIEQLIADYEKYGWEEIDVKDIREIIDGKID